jgi:hypothetical protein
MATKPKGMDMQRNRVLAGLILLMALGACERGEPNLMNLGADRRGPDEFAIVPTQPLQAPPSFAQLPEPTPGGRNLVDPDPRAEAVAALGGRMPAAGSGVPSADGAIIAHAGRFGTSDSIREELAAEDLQFRRRNQGRVLERMFGVNVYSRAYSGQMLDSQAELERWRRAGARVPSAPPQSGN